MSKKSIAYWQAEADRSKAEGNDGAQKFAERRLFQERQKEDAAQDKQESFWRKVNGQ